MTRGMTDKRKSLTWKQDRFVQLVQAGVPMNEAAKQAGYAAGAGAVGGLLHDSRVADTVIQQLQRQLIPWRELSNAAKKALYDNLTSKDAERSIKNAAARIVFDTLKRTDAGTLSDVIEAEDQAANRADMALAILGKHGAGDDSDSETVQ